MIKVCLYGRSKGGLDRMEALLRLVADVVKPTEHGVARGGNHRRYLTVRPPAAPPAAKAKE